MPDFWSATQAIDAIRCSLPLVCCHRASEQPGASSCCSWAHSWCPAQSSPCPFLRSGFLASACTQCWPERTQRRPSSPGGWVPWACTESPTQTCRPFNSGWLGCPLPGTLTWWLGIADKGPIPWCFWIPSSTGRGRGWCPPSQACWGHRAKLAGWRCSASEGSSLPSHRPELSRWMQGITLFRQSRAKDANIDIHGCQPAACWGWYPLCPHGTEHTSKIFCILYSLVQPIPSRRAILAPWLLGWRQECGWNTDMLYAWSGGVLPTCTLTKGDEWKVQSPLESAVGTETDWDWTTFTKWKLPRTLLEHQNTDVSSTSNVGCSGYPTGN